MVKLIVVTPQGELVNEDFDSIIAKGDQGEVGILEDRLPIILRITDGYVKADKEKTSICVAISNGILDNNDSVVTVVSEEACLGNNYEEAKEKLEARRKEILSSNKKKKIDFVQAEKDLAKSIKDSKPSQI